MYVHRMHIFQVSLLHKEEKVKVKVIHAEEEDEDGVHDDDDYVSTTMGAREVLASWLGWFTVSQSNTIS